MELKIREDYNDPWKRFLKKVLKNIDYLSYGLQDETIEAIIYVLEPVTIGENTVLFKSGTK
jgi:hypothetical protein